MAISGRQLRFRRQLPHDAARPCEIAPQGHFLALRAQGATGAKRPRNDKPLAFTVLSIACTGRQHCAGRGMPLPYNARLAALRKIPRSAFHVFFHKFSLSCA